MRCYGTPPQLSCALAHSHWVHYLLLLSSCTCWVSKGGQLQILHDRILLQSICRCCQGAMQYISRPCQSAAGKPTGAWLATCQSLDGSAAASNEAPAGIAAHPPAATPAQPCQHNSSQLRSLEVLRAGMACPADADVTVCWHGVSCRCTRSLHRPRRLHRWGWPSGNVGQ